MSDYWFRDLIDLWNGLAYYSNTEWWIKTEYFCVPEQPWISLLDRWWKIMRMQSDVESWDMIQWKAIMFAGGTPDFAFLAVDITYVAALTYI